MPVVSASEMPSNPASRKRPTKSSTTSSCTWPSKGQPKVVDRLMVIFMPAPCATFTMVGSSSMNVRGVQNAAATAKKPDEVNGVVSSSETHNRANINRTHPQSLEELPTIVKVAHGAGMKITMSLSTTFGCPFEGHVHEDVVLDFVGRFRDAGFDGISLADTTGMANPRQVLELTRKVLAKYPPPDDTYYTLHFHNTRGMGLANVVAGIEAGVRSFDGSLSGLGGCPFAPGATGNICTEDMVNMLEDMGYDTRVDLAKLLAVAGRIAFVAGDDGLAQVMKAGQTLELHDPPEFLRP